MTLKSLLVSVGVGIICSLAGAWAGYRLSESRHRRHIHSDLIADIAEKYRELSERNESAGCDALIRSGVTRLRLRKDIEEVILLIREFGYPDPLSGIREQLKGKDIVDFFRIAKERGRSLYLASELGKAIADTRPE